MPRPRKLAKFVRRIERPGKPDRFRAELTVDGKRKVGTLRATDDEAADDAKNMAEARERAPAKLWTLEDGVAEVQLELRVANARKATFDYYKNHARILYRGWAAETPLHAITADDLRTYVEVRLAEGISPETIWGKELQVLARVFNLAMRRGAVASTPFADVRKPKLRSKQFHWIPLEQMAPLIESIRTWKGPVWGRNKQRDADIIETVVLSGVRRAELSRLRPQDVDMDSGRVFVDGKNRNRYVPISDGLRPALSRLLLRAGGKGLLIGGERKIEKIFARWRKRLNEPRLAPRALRHTFGTENAAEGTSPFDLQLLMGHANLRQTQGYYHGQDARSRAAVNSLAKKLGRRSPDEATTAAKPADESRASS